MLDDYFRAHPTLGALFGLAAIVLAWTAGAEFVVLYLFWLSRERRRPRVP